MTYKFSHPQQHLQSYIVNINIKAFCTEQIGVGYNAILYSDLRKSPIPHKQMNSSQRPIPCEEHETFCFYSYRSSGCDSLGHGYANEQI